MCWWRENMKGVEPGTYCLTKKKKKETRSVHQGWSDLRQRRQSSMLTSKKKANPDIELMLGIRFLDVFPWQKIPSAFFFWWGMKDGPVVLHMCTRFKYDKASFLLTLLEYESSSIRAIAKIKKERAHVSHLSIVTFPLRRARGQMDSLEHKQRDVGWAFLAWFA